MSAECRPICRHIFETQKLVSDFPPTFLDRNKQIVHRIACPPGCSHGGRIVFSRWSPLGFPDVLECNPHHAGFAAKMGYFDYDAGSEFGTAVTGRPTVEWYLNFAHCDLFCAYGTGLFAQDEMQVAEHPALGSLREQLLASGIRPLVVEDGAPTPALVMGVERRCRVEINADAARGRPQGLYGNNFEYASAAAVKLATIPIVPPTVTNLLAMEAPDGGWGRYSEEEIRFILSTAYTGFSAAGVESRLSCDGAPDVVIHTGFWGCGAYGGNRVLMALLQLLAARMAGTTCLVFHVGDSPGMIDLNKAQQILKELESGPSPRQIDDILAAIHSLKFEWGVSDGN